MRQVAAKDSSWVAEMVALLVDWTEKLQVVVLEPCWDYQMVGTKEKMKAFLKVAKLAAWMVALSAPYWVLHSAAQMALCLAVQTVDMLAEKWVGAMVDRLAAVTDLKWDALKAFYSVEMLADKKAALWDGC